MTWPEIEPLFPGPLANTLSLCQSDSYIKCSWMGKLVNVFTQPLRTNMMRHKVNYFSSIQQVYIQSFFSSRPVAIPRLKSPICPNNNYNNNLSQKTRPNNNRQKKKRTCKIVDFAGPADYWIILKECKKRDKYLDLARELKKTMEHEGDNYTNCDWCFWHGN